MIRKLFLILILSQINSECLKNCFLGQSFFSAPLDDDGCCRFDWKQNCDKFIQVTMGKFMCDRCKIGFKWFDNNCKKAKKIEICLNPEIKAIPFHPCRICKFTKNAKYVPIYNPKNQNKYTCERAENLSLTEHQKIRLKNCVASGALENQIFCYKCKKGFFFNWKFQSCQIIKKKSKFEGCQISLNSIDCSVCRSDLQFNGIQKSCVSRKIIIGKGNKITAGQIYYRGANSMKIDPMQFMNNPEISKQMQNISQMTRTVNALKKMVSGK